MILNDEECALPFNLPLGKAYGKHPSLYGL